jgi:hypothetical protein
MLGYTEEDIFHMLESINIAYEIIDVPADVDKGLEKAADFLAGMLSEGRI